MAIAEPVIAYDILRRATRPVDVLGAIAASPAAALTYVPSVELREAFRVYLDCIDLSALEGRLFPDRPWWSRAALLERCIASADSGDAESDGAPPTGTFASVFVRLQLLAHGEPIAQPTFSTHSVPLMDPSCTRTHFVDTSADANAVTPAAVSRVHIFSQWLFLPITIAEVPLDAVAELTVLAGPGPADAKVIGRVAFFVFSSMGRLKAGPRRYALQLDGEDDATRDALAEGRAQGQEGRRTASYRCNGAVRTTTRRLPSAHWEQAEELHRQGRLESVPWLDGLTRHAVQARRQRMMTCPITRLAEVQPELLTSLTKAWSREPASPAARAHVNPCGSPTQSPLAASPDTEDEIDAALRSASEGAAAPAAKAAVPESVLEGESQAALEAHEDAFNRSVRSLVVSLELPAPSSGAVPIYHHTLGDSYYVPSTVVQAAQPARVRTNTRFNESIAPAPPTVATAQVVDAQGTAIAFDPTVAHMYQISAFVPKCTFPYHDPDLRGENIYEAKAALLAKSRMLDAGGEPGYRQRNEIRAILRRPPICLEPLKVDDATLLWQFRTFLTRDPAAFVPFMQSLSWSSAAERSEAERLIPLWRPIPVEDALILLSRLYCMSLPLRRHAIAILDTQTDATINRFLLQLVQGVRYDHAGELQRFLLDRCSKAWDLVSNLYWYVTVESELEMTMAEAAAGSAAGGKQRDGKSRGPTADLTEGERQSLFLYTRMRERLLSQVRERNAVFHRRLQKQAALLKALDGVYSTLQRDAAKDRTKKIALAKELVTQRRCGLEQLFPSAHGAVHHAAIHSVRESSANNSLHASSSGSDVGSGRDLHLQREEHQATTTHADKEGGKGAVGRLISDVITEASKRIQKSPARPADSAAGTAGAADTPVDMPSVLEDASVFLPSHPNKAVDGATADGLYIFKSAKMPMMVPFFEVAPEVRETLTNPSSRTAHRAATALVDRYAEECLTTTGGVVRTAASPQRRPFKVIFKSGDDVRQDQLVIQFVELMDELLKSNGLDLCLTPYRVLATSPNGGFLEVVPDVETFQNVQKDVIGYIQQHNPAPEQFSRAMDRFVKSCAGYCVITFLLGIGDRHLENLLITKDGRLLHIDFGFIFGNDPKPFPPPMKINKEMVEAIGGPQSPQYNNFKTYCCSAYNTLRKHAPLLLNLLVLMLDASIPQISGSSGSLPPPARDPNQRREADTVDPRLNLLKVQDKLRLDLNDAEATQYIQNVIADSVGAIFTNLWDVIHIAAQAARN